MREPERRHAIAAITAHEPSVFSPADTAAAIDSGVGEDGTTVPSLALAVWLLGVAAVGARSLLGVWSAARLTHRSEEITSPEWRAMLLDICRELGVHRPVRLLRSTRASIPMTWGWRRPVVLVTEEAERWSPERRLLVLRHELVHVKRRDYLTQLASQLVTAVYWFNPLVWFAAHRLRVERERACDDEVLHLGTCASTYATHLLGSLVRLTPTRWARRQRSQWRAARNWRDVSWLFLILTSDVSRPARPRWASVSRSPSSVWPSQS